MSPSTNERNFLELHTRRKGRTLDDLDDLRDGLLDALVLEDQTMRIQDLPVLTHEVVLRIIDRPSGFTAGDEKSSDRKSVV